jgi:hypothetical protein
MNASFAVLSKLVDCGVALDIARTHHSLHATVVAAGVAVSGRQRVAALRLFLLAGADRG